MSRLGIVGGGQLARMMALDAARLGVDVLVLAGPHDEGVRGLFPVMDGAPEDLAALRGLADVVDVVTLDHELVPLDVIRALEADGVVVRPGSATLSFTDKLHQRRRFAELGIPVPAFAEVKSLDDIEVFAQEHGWPVVLKAPRGGYDGRGVTVAADLDEADGMIAAADGRALLVEEHLELTSELAVISVTSANQDQTTYEPVVSVQIDGMCREIHADGSITVDLSTVAVRLATRVAQVVGAVGVLAAELFVVERDGQQQVLVNEIAARPHNSGHHTIDGCVTSQFENHVRAVLGMPPGPVAQRDPVSVMVNVVGGAEGSGDPRERVGEVPAGVKVHLYDKTPRPGRKVGHVTATGEDRDTVAALARTAAAILEGRA
ncbi:5-(carboxyamino)imidazole ribonucleotide synthase [Euzebya tangerina]|uniref:5-(carboxyamino)imidazole ribonucleotide synthase n=1 Tax=Euzebya tangerina TaxID=591198 RepID=UPI000E3230A6|nr:5-(carboxyamino)imidazole ribonucleotide synthase [Euzebya tangerina]